MITNKKDNLLKRVNQSYSFFDRIVGELSGCFEMIEAKDMNPAELKRMDTLLHNAGGECEKLVRHMMSVVVRNLDEGLDIVEKKTDEVERSEIRKKLLSK